ncbi:hypothetical protein VKT23_011382 [Stygiomarasmius scandens]|uniref:Tetraspanin Tsp2 n=1 Tax=Marasmiellus scandens TaxID=2682957 RepID=A0ABR1J9C5_9AGAR
MQGRKELLISSGSTVNTNVRYRSGNYSRFADHAGSLEDPSIVDTHFTHSRNSSLDNHDGAEDDFVDNPQFSPNTSRQLDSIVPQRRSILSRAVSSFTPNVSLNLSRASSPSLRRSQSRYAPSRTSTLSVSSGHKSLISSIGTTDKFTNKWPTPRNLKDIETRSSRSSGNNVTGIGMAKAAATALEEGRGLGFDMVGKWTGFKWCLLASVITIFCYGTAAMVCAILTWYRAWDHADVMYVADWDVIVLITMAASILLFTALLGLTGTLLNSRPILATYTLLLWPALISLLAVGYTSYKRYAFRLDLKLNLYWSQYYTPLGRLLIQNSLRCCGYYNPLHEATLSKKCYPRTSLPGCKGKLYRFEKYNLSMIWSATFSIVPLHLLNIITALLCSNHVTREFGKGIMPKQYRLSHLDLREDAEKIEQEFRKAGIERIRRPQWSRASSNATLREDREDKRPLLSEHVGGY